MLGTSELCAVLQVGSHKSRVEGENPLPQPAGHAPLDAAQDSTGFLGWEPALTAHGELFNNHHPKSFTQGCSQSLLHTSCQCVWDCPDPGAGPCTLLSSMRFPLAHFSSLSRFPGMASLPSSASSATIFSYYKNLFGFFLIWKLEFFLETEFILFSFQVGNLHIPQSHSGSSPTISYFKMNL